MKNLAIILVAVLPASAATRKGPTALRTYQRRLAVCQAELSKSKQQPGFTGFMIAEVQARAPKNEATQSHTPLADKLAAEAKAVRASHSNK